MPQVIVYAYSVRISNFFDACAILGMICNCPWFFSYARGRWILVDSIFDFCAFFEWIDYRRVSFTSLKLANCNSWYMSPLGIASISHVGKYIVVSLMINELIKQSIDWALWIKCIVMTYFFPLATSCWGPNFGPSVK